MKTHAADPVELAIFQSAVHSIAEEMGAALRRTALSPNIKERRDYSCAVFDGQGRVIAMGDHMPVHLGSMPMSVQAAIAAIDLRPATLRSSTIRMRAERTCRISPWCCRCFLPGRPAGVLCFESRASCGCGRKVCGIDGAGDEIFRRAFAFLRCALCAVARWIARCST
jgi:hypothetical protein